jgi:putative thioredoxin
MERTVDSWILDIDEEEFRERVFEASRNRPVLVDFWAVWCRPCLMLTPILEKLVEEFQGAFWVMRVNIEKAPSLCQQLRIQSIPLVVVFVDGRPVDQFVGLLTENEIRSFVQRYCPTPIDDLAALAQEKLRQNQLEGARELFEQALREQEGHVAALLGLAEVALEEGNFSEAQSCLKKLGSKGSTFEKADWLVARMYFLTQCQEFGGLDKVQALLSRKQEDLESAYRVACCLAAEKRYQESLEQLLKIVASDRSFREDGARKAMLKVFRILGIQSSLVEQYRNRLARLVF